MHKYSWHFLLQNSNTKHKMGNNQAKVQEIFEESDISEERLEEMFEKIDVSEDGQVTFEELCNFIKWMRAGKENNKEGQCAQSKGRLLHTEFLEY